MGSLDPEVLIVSIQTEIDKENGVPPQFQHVSQQQQQFQQPQQQQFQQQPQQQQFQQQQQQQFQQRQPQQFQQGQPQQFQQRPQQNQQFQQPQQFQQQQGNQQFASTARPPSRADLRALQQQEDALNEIIALQNSINFPGGSSQR